MDKLVEVLTKVYGFTNRMKVDLAFKDTDAAFKTLNELSDYLISVDVAAPQDQQKQLAAAQQAERNTKGG